MKQARAPEVGNFDGGFWGRYKGILMPKAPNSDNSNAQGIEANHFHTGEASEVYQKGKTSFVVDHHCS